MIEAFANWRYRDGGRGELCADGCRFVDCYGLARLVRHERYGLSLLPAFDGVDPRDKAAASAGFGQVIADLRPCPPEDGALVLCWAGRLAVHCAVVATLDGRLGVLEADEGVDVQWVPWRRFQSRFTRVECFT